jgi:CRISPR-associated endoribonuclease Cas6
MRLIFFLRSKCDAVYNCEYNHYVQAFIYDLLKDSFFDSLHLKRGYKFFCFSNIFPIGDLKYGDLRKIVVSSPSRDLLDVLNEKVQNLEEVKIGSFIFEFLKTKKINLRMDSNIVNLITATPIIIRIPVAKASDSGVEVKPGYRYVFWRFGMPFQIFFDQLKVNLIKKYSQYYGKPLSEDALYLFSTEKIAFTSLKEVSTKIYYKTGPQTVIGTTWKFTFKNLNKEEKSFLNFSVETGFGEMNSQGFGFMNIFR